MATSGQPLQIFVTVGSTSFPALLARLLSPTFLSILPPNCQVSIQYGRSELATVLASMDEDNGLMSSSMYGDSSSSSSSIDASASKPAVIYDEGSRLVPEVGLRASKSQGLSYKGSQLNDLDPGRTGSLQGWQMVSSISSSASESKAGRRRKDQIDRETLKGKQRQGSNSSSKQAVNYGSDQDSSEIGSSSDVDSESDDDDPPSTSTNVAFSTLPPALTFKTSSGVQLTLMDFVPDLAPHLAKADIVIAHAGAGTLLETLRFNRSQRSDATDEDQEQMKERGSSKSRPPLLVIVPNTTLMGNHQDELADAMVQGRWAWKATLEPASRGTALDTVLKEVMDVWRHSHDEKEMSAALKSSKLPRAFPAARPDRFRSLVDEEMGFA